MWTALVFISAFLLVVVLLFWAGTDRKFESSTSVASAYDAWTEDMLLERLWGDHVHLGHYGDPPRKKDFRLAKIDFVHELVHWSGLDTLPKGSRVLDVGCGIGGTSRILARDYGFDVVGISISAAQIKRAQELTPAGLKCEFHVMDALELDIDNGSFDGVWSVEVGPHILQKQRYADELLRALRVGGILAVADWNCRDFSDGLPTFLERLVMRQLLNQWAHPEFSSISGFRQNLLNSRFCRASIDSDDWTVSTFPSWLDSIFEGIRRPWAVLGLGPIGVLKAFREIPTIVLMHWAFSNRLMQFGVFRTRV